MWNRGIALVLLSLAIWPGVALSISVTLVEPAHDRYDLARSVDVYVDPAGDMTADELLANVDDPFQMSNAESLTFGFSDATYWFRGRLQNAGHSESRWVMSIAYALLDDVDFYLVDDGGGYQIIHTGDRSPFTTRSLSHRHFNFELDLPDGEAINFLLRVRSESSVQVPLELRALPAFGEDEFTAQLGLGLLYGILLALSLYNLILFLSVRDITYLYYVLYVVSFGFLQMSLNGISFQYFWPDEPGWANIVLLLLMSAAMISMLQFCRSFLSLSQHAKRLDQVFIAISVAAGLMALAAFVVPYGILIRIQTATVILATPAIFAAGIVALRDGYQPARYFLIAWTVLLVGIVAFAMVSFGLLPKVFVTEYGLQIGSSAEMILLSFALAYRINVLTEENERMSLETRGLLEERVAERTRELKGALRQLEDANQSLRETSERDGLTGVFNRRFLEDALREQWAKAVDRETSVALIVLDLDHFKQINDRRGHLAGDDCLKAVARVLSDSLAHESAILARYGGEEFFIVLPNWELNDAKTTAEGLRQAIGGLEIESEDQQFSVTASFGVACMRPGAGVNYRDLIRLADQAMYEAKRRGRNRVVASADLA
jgi:diguanylate cyclase (GGDEF)-like protein